MPKPKYPIPNNNFPRFINEYLRGHSDSQNDMARKMNQMIPKKFAIPIDTSEMKSGNSNIFSWKRENRPKEPIIREALCRICAIDYIESFFLIPANATPKEPIIREALCRICAIDYIESFFLIPANATDYLMKVYNYIADFIKTFDIGDKNISLNMYNIGFVISSNTRAKNYLNLDYLIVLVIRAEEDRKDIFNGITIKRLLEGKIDESYTDELLTEPQPPYTFFERSDANLHMTNEKKQLLFIRSKFYV